MLSPEKKCDISHATKDSCVTYTKPQENLPISDSGEMIIVPLFEDNYDFNGYNFIPNDIIQNELWDDISIPLFEKGFFGKEYHEEFSIGDHGIDNFAVVEFLGEKEKVDLNGYVVFNKGYVNFIGSIVDCISFAEMEKQKIKDLK